MTTKYKLNDRFIQTVKPTGPQTEYFDETLSGFALRVTPRVKAFTYHFSLNGKRQRCPLGDYPSTTLALARTKALEAQAAVQEGSDPRQSNGATLGEVASEWKGKKASLRTTEVRYATLVRHVFPALGAMPIGSIRRGQIADVMDKIEDKAGVSMADVALANLSSVFNWYALRNENFINPIIRGMARNPSNARHRILADGEIKALWNAQVPELWSRYFRFLLLTVVRRNEAAHAAWSEVAGADWTVPEGRMKMKLPHMVPLSPLALTTLGERNCAWMFQSAQGGPINSFTWLKAGLDGASGVADWRIHDVRRTARSLMSRAGVPTEISERCLAHLPASIVQRYDRYEYLKEKRDALAKLATLVGEIVA